jgi:hypothetical protein
MPHRRTAQQQERRRPSRRQRQTINEKKSVSSALDAKVDESLEETFPASDPASWTVIVSIGAPPR